MAPSRARIVAGAGGPPAFARSLNVSVGPASTGRSDVASDATASGARRAVDERNAHWSAHGSRLVGSRNSVVPRWAHSPCSGSAIRLP